MGPGVYCHSQVSAPTHRVSPPQWWQVWGMCGMILELSRISVPGRATPGSPLLNQVTGQECRRVLFS